MTIFPVLTPIVGGVAYPTVGEGLGGGRGAKSIIGRRIPFGAMIPSISGFANYSWHTAMSVAGAFTRARLIFANTTAGAITINGAIVGCSDSAASLLTPTGAGAAW